jgi:nicotinamidase-related amidase
VRDLLGAGYLPFVPSDTVLSRTPDNHDTGLALMREAGATVTSTESVVFDLLGEAGTPEFKKLSALLK